MKTVEPQVYLWEGTGTCLHALLEYLGLSPSPWLKCRGLVTHTEEQG